ncbi:MAG: gliding motility lipoprotein GldH [Flavobacteriaceae bacterium]|nr:gliding motility lipoprotein GldH [Flavobacteriaceae bacterium]
MNKFFFLFGFFSILIACDSNRIFDEYVSIENSKWGKEDTITFNLNVSDTISAQNLFINIRNNNDYKYSNIFIITEILAPNQFTTIDTLEYEMADETGKWLGTGFSDLKENKLFFKENYVFQKSGKCDIKVIHAMRKSKETGGLETLEGIISVGFRIESVNKKQ